MRYCLTSVVARTILKDTVFKLVRPLTYISFANYQTLIQGYVEKQSKYSGCRLARLSTSSSLVQRQDSFFITTPIFYVNASPHMGHLYSCLLADAAARFHRLRGTSHVIFSTGTDEHGLKIQQAAERNKQTPLTFTNDVSASFKKLFNEYNISYTDLIRTTEERHRDAVHHFWHLLETRGYIYKGVYEGWYSVSDEAFLGAEDVKDITDVNGNTIKVAVDSEQPVVWLKEDNYMFALSRLKNELFAWLDTGAVQPSMFESVVRKWVALLGDLSVSRQRSRLSWGIPVPGDESQTIYVWLDALVNYLTVSGYPSTSHTWPPDCHIVGKDILKFHAVFWPAFLMAAGLEPPKKIFCHSHWLIDNFKMSKSRGNVVDPMVMKDKYSADVFRYYLLREGVPHSDGNYNEKVGMEYVNADIVNTLGNLLSRCTGDIINPEQVYPRRNQDAYLKFITAADRETFENMDMLIDSVEKSYLDLHFYKGIESIMSYLRWANGLVQHHEPWVLAKSSSETDMAHLKIVIHIALETLRISGILLHPIVPTLSDRLLDRLGITTNERTLSYARKPYLNSPQNFPLGPSSGVLLKRIKINK